MGKLILTPKKEAEDSLGSRPVAMIVLLAIHHSSSCEVGSGRKVGPPEKIGPSKKLCRRPESGVGLTAVSGSSLMPRSRSRRAI